jgi:hypothetical protein
VDRVPNFWPLRLVYALVLLCVVSVSTARGQDAPADSPKQAAKTAGVSEKPPELPAQIELLETHVRFEANGDSRKEVHTRVHINNELGARQFARLTFDYNRSFQQIEFPLVRITHQRGGTVDILPSAVSDQPNPAVVNAPAYQDVRVKSVRILGLAPGDILEYRVVTIISHHPLAPDFWLDHTFDRSGITTDEVFELDLPTSRQVQVRTSAEIPAAASSTGGTGDAERVSYEWEINPGHPLDSKSAPSKSDDAPDIAITTFVTWSQLSARLYQRLSIAFTTAIWTESLAQIGASDKPVPATTLYNFVSRKIRTIDLPLDFALPARGDSQILDSGYGRPEEKIKLLLILLLQNSPKYDLLLYTSRRSPETQPPSPSLFKGMVLVLRGQRKNIYLDPSLEVAPFGVIRADIRGARALILGTCPGKDSTCWTRIGKDLPFPSFQRVRVNATLAPEGTLTTKVQYTMRGDNELLLRLAFHQAPKEKWKEVAQLLALSDGFRGTITNVTASDPYATKEPFSVEYEITQPKFVDWLKKPVRIPALLPQLGLPDQPTKAPNNAATSAIDLGTPLDVETHLTLHLPAGTSVQTPTGTSVERDYATFASKYAVSGRTVTATRHLNFLLREVQGDRAADYNAFVRAVQGDEAQEFMLERGETATQPKSDVPPAKEN